MSVPDKRRVEKEHDRRSSTQPYLNDDAIAFLRGEVPPDSYLASGYDAAKVRAARYYRGTTRSWSEREQVPDTSRNKWLPALSSDSKAFLDGIITADAFLGNARYEARTRAQRELHRGPTRSTSVLIGAASTLLALIVVTIAAGAILASIGTSALSALIAGVASLGATWLFFFQAKHSRK